MLIKHKLVELYFSIILSKVLLVLAMVDPGF